MYALLVWLILDSEREFRAPPCASWGSNNRNVLLFFRVERSLHACLPFKKSIREIWSELRRCRGSAPPTEISCLCAGGCSVATPFDCTCAMAKLLRQRLDLLRDKLQLICLRETKGAHWLWFMFLSLCRARESTWWQNVAGRFTVCLMILA